MTSFGHILAVISASLLRWSFAATGEAIISAKSLKPMLGDCSINTSLNNTERITNDAADRIEPRGPGPPPPPWYLCSSNRIRSVGRVFRSGDLLLLVAETEEWQGRVC